MPIPTPSHQESHSYPNSYSDKTLTTPLNPSTTTTTTMENPPAKPYWRFTKHDFYPEPSFQTLSSYRSAFKHTLNRLSDRCLNRSSDVTELLELKKQSENDMKKCLTWVDLIWLGFGSVVRSGIFTITGLEARDHAGPSIVLSYVVPGLSALFSVFCYTEFAVEVPVAGGSFSFLRIELGDFVAFIAAVPHFEKMLYDQGQLANVYLDVFSIKKDVFYSNVARDILDYLRRDMIGPSGEIFSAEDADSAEPQNPTKKKEGAFYVWSSDEVEHIRKSYGDYFGIAVAGYPEAHPEVIESNGLATPEAYQKDLEYLKRKVDAGAEVIVTQLFYDVDNFLKFVNDCRQIGITCPIVPGIMPINNYNGFIRMTGFCKTRIPAEITAALESIKDNEEAVRAYGIHQGTEMCKKIMASGIKTLHLYTLNNEKSALAILTSLGLISEAKVSRPLPWRRPTNLFRLKEDVRPIFWANRPKSYITRTTGWEQYPSGRWGDASNASYGALTDHQFMRPKARDKKTQEEWVVPLKKFDDISEKFMKYCLGQLKTSPWSDLDALQPETKIIDEQLASINLKGFLTINSQPAVNGAKSDSPSIGWGPAGGYVYQKAYVEFFCSAEKLNSLVEKIKAYPSLTYIAVNKDGNLLSNVGKSDVNAVTWGVFPAKEIIQPTVVDPASFLIWKDEAFEIWSRGWAQLYPEDDSSRTLLQEVQNTYYLVSLVDNDYINGDLFTVFKGF